MSYIKQRMFNDQEQNRPMLFSEDKYLCAGHIDDYAIKKFILTYSEKAKCCYCKKRRKVALLKDVVNFIDSGLSAFYEDPANSVGYDSREGGYLLPTFEIDELINDEIGLSINNVELQNDIIDSFDSSLWCEKDPYADRESDYLTYNWNYFKTIIKHKSRFLFSQTNQLNEDIHGVGSFEILHNVGRRVDDLNLFTELAADTLLYRIRQHSAKDEVKGIKDIASPPEKFAVYANRMSPAGISMFYSAFDKQTAKAETIEPDNNNKRYYTVGKFKNKDKLFLLDLSKALQIPSRFDKANRKNYFSIIFLKNFIADLTKEIKRDGFEHIDYIPTQVVTEYFRYTYEDLASIKLDGIIYPSAKCKGKRACVLFMDHTKSLQELNLVSIKTYRL